jgi:hypothetical protein
VSLRSLSCVAFYSDKPCDRGNKVWFEEAGIPASQVTELDWWDDVTLTTQPGSDQGLKFICTPAQHGSGTCITFRSQRNRSGFRIPCRPQVYGFCYDALGQLGRPTSTTQLQWGRPYLRLLHRVRASLRQSCVRISTQLRRQRFRVHDE